MDSIMKQMCEMISNEFSGKTFTWEDVYTKLTKETESEVGAGTGLVVKPEKKKKAKGEKKKQKMTVRSYMMTQETDVYKVRVTDRVAENKQHNKDGGYEKDNEDHKDDYKSENFLSVLKEIMSEMSEDELDEIREKVDEYNKKHFPEEASDSE
jgi:hypothetical protein